LSEGPLVRNVVVQVPKFDAKTKPNFNRSINSNPNPNSNPSPSPMPIRQLEPRTSGTSGK